MTTLCDAAMTYAALGWYVFPLKPRGKAPLTPHGVKDATRDIGRIHHWWTQEPSANIGIACGPSGLVVVDLDGEEGAASWRELKQKYALPDQTVTCLTARGQHLYFASRDLALRSSAGRLGPGLDVRAVGGYVVAPPSVHPSGAAYRWKVESSPFTRKPLPFPDALARLLAGPRAAPPAPTSGGAIPGAIPEGRRNGTLTRLAGAMRRQGAGEAEMLAALLRVNADRCVPPLPEDEVRRIVASVSRYPPAEAPDPDAEQRDYGHALVLSRLFRDRYRWAVHRGCWMEWTGKVWQPVPEERVAKVAADALRGEYAARIAATTDREQVKSLAARLTETCLYARIMGALNFLKGWDGILTKAEEWDADPWLLNVGNGILDLQTQTLLPHHPDRLCTRLAPVAYDPQADGGAWQAHVRRFLPNPNIRRQVQRDLGLALAGAVLEEALPIWYGTGANGKTTTARVVQRVLGDYARKAAPDLLVQTRHERHPTEVADLCGARLVFSVEVDAGKRLAEALVKDLTGGDRKKARYMRQDFFEFEQTFSIVLIVNHKPAVAGADEGIWRRLRLVPWEERIPKGEQRPQDEVVHELAGPAVLNWLLDGLRDWQQDHHWAAPEVQAATQAYRAEQDVLGAFLAERCELSPRFSTGVGELYQAYQEWCEAAGEEALGKHRFGALLRQRGMGQERAGGGTRRWAGLRLRRDNL